jgi:hypothetical protein
VLFPGAGAAWLQFSALTDQQSPSHARPCASAASFASTSSTGRRVASGTSPSRRRRPTQPARRGWTTRRSCWRGRAPSSCECLPCCWCGACCLWARDQQRCWHEGVLGACTARKRAVHEALTHMSVCCAVPCCVMLCAAAGTFSPSIGRWSRLQRSGEQAQRVPRQIQQAGCVGALLL